MCGEGGRGSVPKKDPGFSGRCWLDRGQARRRLKREGIRREKSEKIGTPDPHSVSEAWGREGGIVRRPVNSPAEQRRNEPRHRGKEGCDPAMGRWRDA